VIFRILPKDVAAGVFSYISYELQRYIVESITDSEIKNILDELFLDDTIDFLEEMPSNIVKRVLKNADETTRKLINQFLNYPENEKGNDGKTGFAAYQGDRKRRLILAIFWMTPENLKV